MTMGERRCDVAVIGAGTAGLKAYKAATARGADVLLIERGEGGSTCTRVGCMPSKLLLAAGNAAAAGRRASTFGVHAEPVVDGEAVLRRLRAERDRFVRSVLDEYHAIPAERRLHGEARFTGPDTLSVGDTIVHAGAIVIATGATPTIPDSLAPVRDRVRTHDTIFEIEALPARLAVLGAGPVGIELAQAFARLGCTVTVIDDGDSIGALADPESGKAAIAALAAEVDLRLGVEVTASPVEGGARLQWTGKSEGAVTVDMILAATGRPPSLDSLNLAATGLDLDDHGVPLFDRASRRCGSSSIFIAGDVGVWRPVLHEAARGGHIAGQVAAGGEASRVLPNLAMTFTEPNLVEVGCAFADLPDGHRIGQTMMCDNGRATIEAQALGLVRLYGDATGRLIGASIVAHGGEHLGQLVALGIDRGISAADFADQAWYHPTVEEALQSAARDLAGIAD
ncbi:dihydrolipoyl dehydrogenase [Sphingomonas sp. KR1UV-12]|uniref:Dihydrolipoyl dehydrogenase n=1 Tax=Sphingomonas aurea TaxID=3063994 RepID=A0ABT9ENU9_9SPHN|nr:dihydrolipoyl dehydrogenase [Sphingomonas sp. KR1UV-12]MDP1028638.1 dihydrolipoyl dehydrogenase [Sphingomonas sp. KR1UV-12]